MRAWRVVSRAILPLAARHLRTHGVVVGVAAFALACGVASVMATQVLYKSVLGSYQTTALRFAGRAALQVTNGESGVAEELADEIRGVPGVQAAAASVEGFVSAPDLPGERLYLYGVDLLADQQVRDYGSGSDGVVSDPLVFLAAPDSVALTAEFASARRLALNDRLRVLAPVGIVDLTVRALLAKQHGPASVLDGRLAVVDLSVAQDLLSMPGRVSEVAIALDPNADVATVARAVAERVGGRGVVGRPQSRAATFARLLTNYRYGLLLAAAISMIVALYFVCTMATIAVVERRRELGLLRAVGMRARQVALLVLMEVLALSALACVMGVPLGVGLARLLVGTFGANVAALYGDIGGSALQVPVSAVLWSLALGVSTPLLAAMGPLRRAVAVRPLEVLRTSVTEGVHAPRYVGSAGAGVAIIAGSTGIWVARAMLPISAEDAGLIAMLGAVVGVALGVPLAVRSLVMAGDRLAALSGRPLALLACRNSRADVRRIAITCSALLVSLAGTIAVATWMASLDATLNAAFDSVFAKIDLVVSAGADPFAVQGTRLPDSVVADIAARPEVAYVDAVRIDTIAFEGSRVAVVADDARLYRDGRHTLYLIDGDPRAVAEGLASGSAVVVNQAFARRFGRRRGDVLNIGTPTGPLRVRIAGIHLELTPGDLGTIRLDRALYRRWWRDTTASLVEVALKSAADRRPVVDGIRARWGERHRVVVLTIEELRQEYRAMLRQLATLVAPLLGVSVASALIGVVSASAAAMIARRRVSGVLRMVGATRNQLAWLFGLEAALVAGVAAAVAAVVGSGLGWMQVEVLLRGMLGMSVIYSYPLAVGLLGGSMVVLATGTAGWALGWRAGRMALGEAVRWE